MRARNIKPAFFTNEILGTLDPIICLTFEGLWCLADRDGILEDRPLRIKAELFPYRENLDVNGYITVLERCGFVQRYKVDGVCYIEVLNFTKHQNPHNTEKSKGFPPNPLKGKNNVEYTLDNGEITVTERPDSLIPDSLIHESCTPKKATLALTRFAEFWAVYPRRDDKAKAEKSWAKQSLDKIAEEVIDGANAYARSKIGTERQFIALPTTWLNGKRWQDEKPIDKPVVRVNVAESKPETDADKAKRKLEEQAAWRMQMERMGVAV